MIFPNGGTKQVAGDDASTCAERVRSRDATEHIPVSDERVREINRVAEGVRPAWDLEVDNSGRRSAEDVARDLARALAAS